MPTFSDGAQRALHFATQSSLDLHSNYLGTEHLLLGLLQETGGQAALALAACNLSLAAVEQSLGEIFGPPTSALTAPQPQPTERVRQVLLLADQAVTQNGNGIIDTTAILLAILVEREGVAAKVLADHKITRERILAALQPVAATVLPSPSLLRPTIARPATPFLDEFGEDLNAKAERGELDPVIGRDPELLRVQQILARRTKSNPALLGDAGVGKTAIAEGLAQLIVAGAATEALLDSRIISISVGTLIAGTHMRGEMEERIKGVINEARQNPGTILFIDELHTLLLSGGRGVAQILKPYLDRREIKLIGATTLNEYRQYIEKDAALERRFQPIYVDPTTVAESIEILKGSRRLYETHHNVKISDAALVAAVKLSERYDRAHKLPDKAISLIDETCARVRMKNSTFTPELLALADELSVLKTKQVQALGLDHQNEAADFRTVVGELHAEFVEQRDLWRASLTKEVLPVDAPAVADLMAARTGRPIGQLLAAEAGDLLNLEARLHQRLVGQDDAVNAVARAIRRARAGLKDARQPIGAFLFLGPTGVGKTELARALAEVLFDDPDAMVRLDMSEFMERHLVARLTGAPPGYKGYDEGGQLTEAVRRRPYSVLLLDEIEKAHPEVFHLLLQIIDHGILSDAKGKEVDFSETVIVMTSNLGSTELHKHLSLGFQPTPDAIGVTVRQQQAIRAKARTALNKFFPVELIGRIESAGQIVVFDSLLKDQLLVITEGHLGDLSARVAGREMRLVLTPEAKAKLAADGYSQEYGARPLRRLIETAIGNPLSDILLGKDNPIPTAGAIITVDVAGGEFAFAVHEPLKELGLVAPPAPRELLAASAGREL